MCRVLSLPSLCRLGDGQHLQLHCWPTNGKLKAATTPTTPACINLDLFVWPLTKAVNKQKSRCIVCLYFSIAEILAHFLCARFEALSRPYAGDGALRIVHFLFLCVVDLVMLYPVCLQGSCNSVLHIGGCLPASGGRGTGRSSQASSPAQSAHQHTHASNGEQVTRRQLAESPWL